MFSFFVVIILSLTFLITCGGYSPTDEDEITIHSGRTPFPVQHATETESSKDEWKLRYFPGKSLGLSVAEKMFADDANLDLVSPECDDAETNLLSDWNESSDDYTCSQNTFPTNVSILPIIRDDFIPPAYRAPNFCVNTKIDYPPGIITFGGHRPLWAHYGEYKFIPRQRWLHNCENGAVIMLYHSCANIEQVEQLRSVVTSCLRRHIITPYNLLPSDRPLALITWGWYLSMNSVDVNVVMRFIKEHALHGPKSEMKDGKYDKHLIKTSNVVSDEKDSLLCPNSIHE